jgi:hypothetical protein
VSPDKAQYDAGEVVRLIPLPSVGYSFDRWTGDYNSHQLAPTIKMDSDKSITANFVTWTPPIGIPAPPFGILETYRMYDDADPAATRRNPDLTYRESPVGGYYTHYIDNTHPASTDTSNPYGTASKPRKTLPINPTAIPEGSIVEIHGGPYVKQYGYTLRILGTEQRPVFIRGYTSDSATMPEFSTGSYDTGYGIFANGQWCIIENLYMHTACLSISVDGQGKARASGVTENHHFAFRNIHSEGAGILFRYDNIVAQGSSTVPVHDIVIYACHVHNHGDPSDPGQVDVCGVVPCGNMQNIWVVDNHIYDNGGDTIQSATGESGHHLYIGRNVMHDDGENAIDIKGTDDVIMSQNDMFSYNTGGLGGSGEVVCLHVQSSESGPQRNWLIANYITDANTGISCSGTTTSVYMIGNIIRDMSGAAIQGWSGQYFYTMGNTITDCGSGIVQMTSTQSHIANNIIANLRGSNPLHLDVHYATMSDVSECQNNIIYQNGKDVRLYWGSTTYKSVAAFQSATGKGQNCLMVDPLFVDAANHDFRLQPASPAIDAGLSSGVVQQVFDLFQQSYGIDIRKDITGQTRTGQWDIGAYEQASGSIDAPEVPGTTTGASNHAPVIEPVGDQSVTETKTLTFVVRATDADGDALTYSAPNLPAGASFDPGTRTFTWTPASGQKGTYSVGFSVNDGKVTVSRTVKITVTEPAPPENQGPTLARVDDQSVDENASLSFSLSASDPDGDSLTFAATGLPTGANFENGTFSWVPAFGQAGSYPVDFSVTDGKLADSQQMTITVVHVTDQTAPSVQDLYPGVDEVQVPLNPLIGFTIADAGSGVDANSVNIQVDGRTIYAGNQAVQQTAYGTCRRAGTPATYSYNYNPAHTFNFDQQVSVCVSASDRARNVMTPVSYQFVTEMQSFGRNEPVSSNSGGAGHPVVATDSHGNIWAAWHAGQPNARDIYVARRSSQTQQWDAPVQLTNLSSDQCGPAVAIGSDDAAYIAWQDNHRGNWDIYVSASVNGSAWREPVRITDSNDNQTNPVMAVDRSSPNRVYIAWEDDSAGNRDIYLASLTSSFAGKTIARVTSDAADQTGPALAVGSNNVAYLVWTDRRNGSADVYGSSSGAAAWANVPIVTGPGNQRDPVIGVEPGTSLLQMLWVDDTAGNLDVFYGTSNGLPASPISGRTIIDDSTAADQFAPAIVIAKDYQNISHIYACWQDNRSIADSADSDLYFAEIRSGAGGTNILVGDDSTNSNQGEPVLGFDEYGQPVVLWIDDRSSTAGVYAACSTYPKPEVLASALIPAPQGGEVGKDPASRDDGTGVSVKIPSNACRFDTFFRILQMRNPPSFRSVCITGYEIGPSGMQFAVPVTVTIPQTGSTFGQGVPYWYNPQTGTLSQQGVTEVTNRILANGTPVVSFKTTHLTTFYVLERSVDGGAGGCALSQFSQVNVVEFFLPYAALVSYTLFLRRKDRRRCSQD